MEFRGKDKFSLILFLFTDNAPVPEGKFYAAAVPLVKQFLICEIPVSFDSLFITDGVAWVIC